jgi:hypothetical protein
MPVTEAGTATRGRNSDVAEMVTLYRRLAAMDPPALRSLAVELERLSNESSASAALLASPTSQAKANRDAQRAAAARAALGSIESES